MSDFVSKLESFLKENKISYQVQERSLRYSKDKCFNLVFFKPQIDFIDGQVREDIRFSTEDIILKLVIFLQQCDLTDKHKERFIAALNKFEIKHNLNNKNFCKELINMIREYKIPLRVLEFAIDAFFDLGYDWYGIEQDLIENYIDVYRVYGINKEFIDKDLLKRLPLIVFTVSGDTYAVPWFSDIVEDDERTIFELYFALLMKELPCDSHINNINQFKHLVSPETFKELKHNLIEKDKTYILKIKG